MGRPGPTPSIYLRVLLVGYFEGIDSEGGIAWRAADSSGIRLEERQIESGKVLSLSTVLLEPEQSHYFFQLRHPHFGPLALGLFLRPLGYYGS